MPTQWRECRELEPPGEEYPITSPFVALARIRAGIVRPPPGREKIVYSYLKRGDKRVVYVIGVDEEGRLARVKIVMRMMDGRWRVEKLEVCRV